MPKPFHGRGAPNASETERHLRAVIRSQHLQMEQQQADKVALLDELEAAIDNPEFSMGARVCVVGNIINREKNRG